MEPAVDDEAEVGKVAGGLDDGCDLVAEVVEALAAADGVVDSLVDAGGREARFLGEGPGYKRASCWAAGRKSRRMKWGARRLEDIDERGGWGGGCQLTTLRC